MTDEILGLTHECQDADCHVPGFVRTLRARLADAEARAEAAGAKVARVEALAERWLAERDAPFGEAHMSFAHAQHTLFEALRGDQ